MLPRESGCEWIKGSSRGSCPVNSPQWTAISSTYYGSDDLVASRGHVLC
jgi:hypothetical protein